MIIGIMVINDVSVHIFLFLLTPRSQFTLHEIKVVIHTSIFPLVKLNTHLEMY